MARFALALLVELYVLIFVGVRAQSDGGESLLVQIAQGPVRGYKDAGGDLFNFYNIPYATAPTGTQRFKAPLPPPVWMQTLDAVDRGVICPQRRQFPIPETLAMREDCLVANVFVPDIEETNLSVAIYIHGGAFEMGFGNAFRLKNLVRTKKIVGVTFNYRLGVHGFLCLGTEDVPGNAGMKDQVALLRWVKANIASFGGNPDDVTIVGCSAGGSSVDILSLSKTTSGLFNKIIPESGATFGSPGIQLDPISNAKRYASVLNFTELDNITALEEFYKTSPLESVAAVSISIPHGDDSSMLFAPCIERETGAEIFLDKAPATILKSGDYTKLPMLFGLTNREGLFRLPNFNQWKDRMNERFSDFLPADLLFESEEQKQEVADAIKRFYFGDETVSDRTILAYIDYFTDVMFTYPMLKSLNWRIESNNDTIYLYEYSFVDDNTPLLPNSNEHAGADHCDQSFAVLDENKINITEEYGNMKSTIRTLWLNFILNGNPMPEGSPLIWPKSDSSSSPHMSLGQSLELRGSLLRQRYIFWDDIYERFYRTPMPPAASSTKQITPSIAPHPPPVWMQPLEAVDRRIICPQTLRIPGATMVLNMREDCLVVNVFVPDTEDTKLPVVVYIHGGAYVLGFGNAFRLKSLVRTKKIIAVTFNYRLGVHGFLCLGTEDVPGNAGMKDQVALLRWVKANIASFGGNPEDVTIMGCSAGSGSVDILTLSKTTSGLFKKAIYGSGSTFGGLSVQLDPIKNAKSYANILNFTNTDNITALEEFYKTAPLQSITIVSESLMSAENSGLLFSPCIERETSEERFLEEAPVNIIWSGDYPKFPLLYGFTNREGLFRLPYFDRWKVEMNERFTDFLPADLYFENQEQKEEVANVVKSFYFGNQTVSDETILEYIDYFTDVMFAYPMLKSLNWRLKSNNDTIYLYEYSFVDNNTRLIPHTNERAGANHCDQDFSVLDEDETNFSEEYRNMKSTMRTLWLNFILTGNPVPVETSSMSWPRTDADRSPYMSLGNTLELKGSLLEERVRFWDNMYEKYYRIPVPPPSPNSSFMQVMTPTNLATYLSMVYFFALLMVS